jgi:hypothetical protein
LPSAERATAAARNDLAEAALAANSEIELALKLMIVTRSSEGRVLMFVLERRAHFLFGTLVPELKSSILWSEQRKGMTIYEIKALGQWANF